MKIRRKHIINIREADLLIEKYYDGLTSVEEERQLQKFMTQQDLPERFEADKSIFGYFDQKKHKPSFRIYPILRWVAGAAVILTAVFSLHLFMNTQPSNYACIDGKKTTDILKIKSTALASLSEISSTANEVDEGFKNINNLELMEQQLNVFSESDN